MEVQFEAGIIALSAVDGEFARKAVADLDTLDWRPAMVAQKHDVYRMRETVDASQRDALAVGIDRSQSLAERLLEVLRPAILSAIEEKWALSLSKVSSPQFTLYRKGHFIKAHRDSGAAYPDRIFTAVTYLNSDYDGGEIVFPALGNSYHPEPGQTLVFPSDFVHEVKSLEKGSKYIFLFFVDR